MFYQFSCSGVVNWSVTLDGRVCRTLGSFLWDWLSRSEAVLNTKTKYSNNKHITNILLVFVSKYDFSKHLFRDKYNIYLIKKMLHPHL